MYRPFGGPVMSYFSSRGPNANGRVEPSVVANGFASFGMGFAASTNVVSFADGTSFAAPSVAGVAAVLRQAFPSATARQIRNAIIMSADPTLVSAASHLDQGAGFVNAAGARDLLAAGKAPDTAAPPLVSVSSVRVNVQKAGLKVADDYITEPLSNLMPGERHDVVFSVKPNNSQLVVSISDFSAAPPEQQNVLFGDELLLGIHSAKTSQIGQGDYIKFVFTSGGTFIVNRPEPGLVRVSVNGAWTNAKPVSANVTVIALVDPIVQFTAQGKIVQSEDVYVPFNVPAGTKLADFRLSWRDDWGTFPTADIDLFLISPSSKDNRSAATGSSPETTTIENPEPGTWLARIAGNTILSKFDKFELRIALDGVVIR
ncbi:MAG: S8 family serine peptidase [Bryobacteraceae bacterium]|nr:S8 family serine peptidase [Bryobacteraceae bacterium]